MYHSIYMAVLKSNTTLPAYPVNKCFQRQNNFLWLQNEKETGTNQDRACLKIQLFLYKDTKISAYLVVFCVLFIWCKLSFAVYTFTTHARCCQCGLNSDIVEEMSVCDDDDARKCALCRRGGNSGDFRVVFVNRFFWTGRFEEQVEKSSLRFMLQTFQALNVNKVMCSHIFVFYVLFFFDYVSLIKV